MVISIFMAECNGRRGLFWNIFILTERHPIPYQPFILRSPPNPKHRLIYICL